MKHSLASLGRAIKSFRRGWLAGLFLLLGTCAAERAQAQTTKASAADSTATPAATPTSAAGGLPSSEFETYGVKNGVRYTATVTGIYSTGTVERVYFTSSQTGNFKLSQHWLLPTALTFSYGKQDGLLRERELVGLLTPTYQRGRVKYYLLGDAEQSNLRAIARRLVTGAGAGYQLYTDTLHNEISVSQFFLYENTQYLSDLRREVSRSSTRLKLRGSRGQLVLSGLLYYQPSLEDFTGDYRLNLTSGLTYTLNKNLGLTVAYSYSYESVAVDGRAPGNGNLTIGFTYVAGK